jgi:hypothetical protein
MNAMIAAVVFAAVLAGGGSADQPRYAIGQVWEYKARPGDEGSVLKIQQIDDDAAFKSVGPVYHITVIGFHFSNPHVEPVLPHAPVSKATLDASVTRLSDRADEFPDARPGIAEWKQANGGVYTISVAQIIDVIDRTTQTVGQ